MSGSSQPALRLECRHRLFMSGALLVVSHDAAFLDGLDLDEQLTLTRRGWQLEPRPPAQVPR
ncbi:MAG TPA: hypothetical protein VGE56_07595 [Rhodocyclaceae bacterium]